MSFSIRRTPRKSLKIEPKKTMTDQEINKAIAEAVRWPEHIPDYDACLTTFASKPPDYANDLNAMHEAENCLSETESAHYAKLLHRERKHHYLLDDFCVAHSTARQRAEAFLRTLGKWREA